MSRAAKIGELAFEGLHFRAFDKRGILANAIQRRQNLVAQSGIFSFQIKEWNFHEWPFADLKTLRYCGPCGKRRCRRRSLNSTAQHDRGFRRQTLADQICVSVPVVFVRRKAHANMPKDTGIRIAAKIKSTTIECPNSGQLPAPSSAARIPSKA